LAKNLGVVQGTAENRETAASGEDCEWTNMNKEFAEVGRREGNESFVNG